MAFQQIHINAPTGLDSLRESLVRMAQNQRQREQDAADNLRYGAQKKRQGMMDRQAALAKASELWQQGDREGAKAIMAPYGGQVEQYQTDTPKEWAPKLNQGEIDFADTLPMDRPGGPVAPQPQAPPKPDPVNFSFGGYTPPPDGSERAGDAELGGLMAKATNPLVAAAQAQAQQNKIMAQRLTGKFDDGTAWSIDPDQGKREGMARADKAFYDASGEDTDEADQIREQYPQLRATYAAAGQDIDPKGVFAQFRSDAAGKRAEAGADRRESERIAADERRNAEWDRRFPQIEAGKNGRVAMGGAKRNIVTPNQREDNERADVGAFENAATKWEKANNVGKLTDDFDTFTKMKANVDNYKHQRDTVGLKGALYGAARYITGPGVLTAQEYGNTVTNTAGWSAALETKIRNGLQGEISPDEYAALEKFVDNANQTIRARAIRAIRTFDTKHANSRYMRTVPDEVAGYRDALIGRFGLNPEEVGAPPAPKVKGGAQAPTAKAAPSATDQAAVEWARANPKDPRAAAILKANGM
jgi:hypothetical protein